jgi:hypothetical protein
MAYTIQALIADDKTLRSVDLEKGVTPLISLPQGRVMLPLTTEVSGRFDIPFLPLTNEGSLTVPDLLNKLCCAASRHGLIAYIEAEFFGGAGTQASALWDRGSLVMGPIVADDAINQVLRAIGVSKGGAFDEFDALDLGKHRDTDDWAAENEV